MPTPGTSNPPARRVADIAWESWTPEQRATLLFVIRDGRMLLIHKKRGLGAGTISAPGGRLEPGETALDAAIREVREEVCVTPRGIAAGGELFFQFVDGLSLHCTVFRADDCDGSPAETDEATPFWVSLDAIPYTRMWADDTYWLPLLLARRRFIGHFIFDGPAMLDHTLTATEAAPSAESRIARP